jgi:uncharacterized protein (DUF488 family)
MNDRPTLFSVGHSTHPIETLAELLKAQNIACLIDVRSYPSSRRWPQFNQTQLQQSLESMGVTYQWAKTLGGRRSSKRADSPHGNIRRFAPMPIMLRRRYSWLV